MFVYVIYVNGHKRRRYFQEAIWPEYTVDFMSPCPRGHENSPIAMKMLTSLPICYKYRTLHSGQTPSVMAFSIFTPPLVMKRHIYLQPRRNCPLLSKRYLLHVAYVSRTSADTALLQSNAQITMRTFRSEIHCSKHSCLICYTENSPQPVCSRCILITSRRWRW